MTQHRATFAHGESETEATLLDLVRKDLLRPTLASGDDLIDAGIDSFESVYLRHEFSKMFEVSVDVSITARSASWAAPSPKA